MRFGNSKPYSLLKDIFTLYDKDGNPGALTGTYNIKGQDPIVRKEDSLYYEDFKTVGRLLPKGLDNATVVIEGQIEPKQSGEYKFLHYYSGYQSITIDGKNVYPSEMLGSDSKIWRTAWNPNARKFSVNLEKGKKYSLRIEWTPDGGEAYCGLRALEPVDKATQNKLSVWSEMTQQLDYYSSRRRIYRRSNFRLQNPHRQGSDCSRMAFGLLAEPRALQNSGRNCGRSQRFPSASSAHRQHRDGLELLDNQPMGQLRF